MEQVENSKTVKEILVENEVYQSTALSKKMVALKRFIEDEKKTYSIDSKNVEHVIEMLKLIIESAKGQPKTKLLVILSEYGIELNEKEIVPRKNSNNPLLTTPKILNKITAIDNPNISVGAYDVNELLKEIDAIASEKINKAKKAKAK